MGSGVSPCPSRDTQSSLCDHEGRWDRRGDSEMSLFLLPHCTWPPVLWEGKHRPLLEKLRFFWEDRRTSRIRGWGGDRMLLGTRYSVFPRSACNLVPRVNSKVSWTLKILARVELMLVFLPHTHTQQQQRDGGKLLEVMVRLLPEV